MIEIEDIKEVLGPEYAHFTEDEFIQLRSDAYEIVNYLLNQSENHGK